jgi:phosphoglycerate dehydrogenase-like enzyme
MKLSLHFIDEPSQHMLELLRTRVGEDVVVTSGRINSEIRPDYDVLIGGNPTQRHLDTGKPLILLLPYSGLPLATQRLLLLYPNVTVFRIPFSSQEVAEMALALLLVAAKGVISAHKMLEAGSWSRELAPRLLHGERAVILGFGEIGTRIATMLKAIGMNVTAVRRREYHERESSDGRTTVTQDLASALSVASVLIVCLPLTENTSRMIGTKQLRLLPCESIIVNVARAEIFDEEDLYNELKHRPTLLYASDVWYQEECRTSLWGGRVSKFPFQELGNVILSPHRAWRSTRNVHVRDFALLRLVELLLRGETLPYRINVKEGY